MSKGVQRVSISSIVYDHQCSLSLLHMSHRAMKLNVYAAHSPAHGTRVVCLVLLDERSSIYNPIEAR